MNVKQWVEHKASPLPAEILEGRPWTLNADVEILTPRKLMHTRPFNHMWHSHTMAVPMNILESAFKRTENTLFLSTLQLHQLIQGYDMHKVSSNSKLLTLLFYGWLLLYILLEFIKQTTPQNTHTPKYQLIRTGENFKIEMGIVHWE